ncbi:MAG: potassium channel family protein, partial [Chloroflexota bacterium]
DASDALWWSVTTVTTVGYGDRYPVTPFGRAIAVFLMLAGIVLFSLLTASLSAMLVQRKESTTEDKLDQLLARVENLERKMDQG